MAYGQRNVVIYSAVLLTMSLFLTQIICDNADAQVDQNTLESIFTNQTRSASNKVAQISMVGSPGYLFGASTYDKLYVVNSLSEEDKNGTVSVIDARNDTLIQNIPVGVNPEYIYRDLSVSSIICVVNSGSPMSGINASFSSERSNLRLLALQV